MNQKLGCILLIDDNEADNFLHQLVLEESGCVENIIVKESAEEALKFLKSPQAEAYIRPDLIFLDINMPGMNGWDFLQEYEKLEDSRKSKIVVVMLSTSLLRRDRENANQLKSISEFQNKPLSEDYLRELFQKYFTTRV